jgi:hypothetical protein
LLAREIAVVDCFLIRRPLHCLVIASSPPRSPRQSNLLHLHTPHPSSRVVAGHTQAPIAHHNNNRINKSIRDPPHYTTLLRMEVLPHDHHHERTPDLPTSR